MLMTAQIAHPALGSDQSLIQAITLPQEKDVTHVNSICVPCINLVNLVKFPRYHPESGGAEFLDCWANSICDLLYLRCKRDALFLFFHASVDVKESTCWVRGTVSLWFCTASLALLALHYSRHIIQVLVRIQQCLKRLLRSKCKVVLLQSTTSQPPSICDRQHGMPVGCSIATHLGSQTLYKVTVALNAGQALHGQLLLINQLFLRGADALL